MGHRAHCQRFDQVHCESRWADPIPGTSWQTIIRTNCRVWRTGVLPCAKEAESEVESSLADWPYLGIATSPNEHVISTKQGNVVKVRSVCRVAEASRWSLQTVLGVTGTPTRLCPAGPEDIHAKIEHFEQPHSHVDEATADQVDDNTEEAKVLSKHMEAKITDKDLRLDGVSHNYPRCSGLQKGQRHPFRPHSV